MVSRLGNGLTVLLGGDVSMSHVVESVFVPRIAA